MMCSNKLATTTEQMFLSHNIVFTKEVYLRVIPGKVPYILNILLYTHRCTVHNYDNSIRLKKLLILSGMNKQQHTKPSSSLF